MPVAPNRTDSDGQRRPDPDVHPGLRRQAVRRHPRRVNNRCTACGACERMRSPWQAPEVYPEHDLFIQLMKLKNTLRYMRGEQLITHLGREYYD